MRGTKHDYLGMRMLDYGVPGEVMIRMDDYISDLSEEAPQDIMARMAATPTGDHLFKISKNPEYLGDLALELFHHLTAKLLFLFKWLGLTRNSDCHGISYDTGQAP